MPLLCWLHTLRDRHRLCAYGIGSSSLGRAPWGSAAVSAAPAPGDQAQHVQGQFPCLVRELDERPVTTCGVVDAGAARERGGQASFSLRRYYILYLANPAACVKERSYPGTRSK